MAVRLNMELEPLREAPLCPTRLVGPAGCFSGGERRAAAGLARMGPAGSHPHRARPFGPEPTEQHTHKGTAHAVA